MAIYHLSAKAVSRGAGRSATAAAAYRAGERIEDERTGAVFDYARKRGVEHREIVMPSSCAWQPDRAALWNAAEAAERRKDACVAREVEVALPAELTADQRRALARDLARSMADAEGCAVDVAIHAPHRQGDGRNHHAHILRTTRRVEGEGLGAKLDTEKAGRNRRADLEGLRGRWAVLTNEHLARAGHAERVDHRTLEAQGLKRTPTRHLGPAATGYERRTGEPSERRKSWQMEAEASQRLASAAAQAPEVRHIAHQEIALDADLGAALRERERVRAVQAVERPRPQSATNPIASRQAEKPEASGASRAPERPRPGVLQRDLAVLTRERDALVATRDQQRGEAVRGAFRDQSDEWEARRSVEKAKGFFSRNREVVLYLPRGEELREALLAVERSSRQTKISAANQNGAHYIELADGSYLRSSAERGAALHQYPRAEVAEWAAEHLQAGVDRVTSARQKVLDQHQPQIDAVERQIAQERQARDRAEYLRQQQERQQRQERLRREAEQAREREVDKQLTKSLEELKHQGYDVDQPGFSAGLRAELVKQRDAAERAAQKAERDNGLDFTR